VWEIADELAKAAGTSPLRRDVVDRGISEGIALATVQTQFNRWRRINGAAKGVPSEQPASLRRGRNRRASADLGEKVADVLENARRYHARFYEAKAFDGPSLHFHRRALGPVTLEDQAEFIYAVLASWGMCSAPRSVRRFDPSSERKLLFLTRRPPEPRGPGGRWVHCSTERLSERLVVATAILAFEIIAVACDCGGETAALKDDGFGAADRRAAREAAVEAPRGVR